MQISFSGINKTITRPKLDILREQITEAEKEYLQLSSKINWMKRNLPQMHNEIFANEKQLFKIQQKVQKITEEYNKFAAKQNAIQKMFDKLNQQ